MTPYRIEACVETLVQGQAAEAGGAHQIELCADLSVGGLTPSLSLVQQTRAALSIPLKVMIRPRAGDFVYSDAEIQRMLVQIEEIKRLGVRAFVLGMTTGSQLDLAQIRFFTKRHPDLQFTIHKAIDEVSDPVAAVRQLAGIPGVKSVLSSGQAPTAREGAATLREMVRAAADQLEVIAAGRITAQNLAEIHALIGAPVYHGRRII